MLRLRGSKRAEDAILAAEACELRQCWLREGIDEPLGGIEGWEELDARRREREQSHRCTVSPRFVRGVLGLRGFSEGSDPSDPLDPSIHLYIPQIV